MLSNLFAASAWVPTLLYIDPGTGALLWQLLAGIGLGIAFYFNKAKNWIKSVIPGLGTDDA